MADDLLPAVPDDAEVDAAPADTSYEVVLDDEPGAPETVHDGGVLAVLPDEAARLPVIPVHLRTVAGVRSAAAARTADVAHGGAFHAVRSPWYLLVSTWWAVVGVFRLLWVLWCWVMVSDQNILRSQAVASGDSQEYRRLEAQWKKTHDYRLVVTGIAAVPAAIGVIAMTAVAPWWGWALLGAAALPLLARAGRPADRPIITPA